MQNAKKELIETLWNVNYTLDNSNVLFILN